jgi:hypothetical protein
MAGRAVRIADVRTLGRAAALSSLTKLLITANTVLLEGNSTPLDILLSIVQNIKFTHSSGDFIGTTSAR